MIESTQPADVTIVMPAFNENATILQSLDRVLSQPFVREVIVVDDGSTDGTRDLLAEIADDRVRVELHPHNRGKGAALRTGIALATSDFVAVQDADLEYYPADLVPLLGPLRDGRADVVYGSRFSGSSANRPFHR